MLAFQRFTPYHPTCFLKDKFNVKDVMARPCQWGGIAIQLNNLLMVLLDGRVSLKAPCHDAG